MDLIRKAETKDSEEFCNVILTSITELCRQDHKDDVKLLSEWLENKTVENCKKWISSERSTSLVAVRNTKVIGVAQMSHDGHLLLCYLLPEVKGQGVGHKLLVAAEESVIKKGIKSLTLESTLTARKFYECHGYKHVGSTFRCLQYAKTINP
jgi:N-acetylglutamate synthase-like GNAT family acetyltransferase